MGLGGIQNSTRQQEYKELYFELLPPYRRHGLGTKFATFLINFHKKVYGNRPIEAVVVPENTPSKGLLRKLGFKPKLTKDGTQDKMAFAKWGNRVFEIFRYTPADSL